MTRLLKYALAAGGAFVGASYLYKHRDRFFPGASGAVKETATQDAATSAASEAASKTKDILQSFASKLGEPGWFKPTPPTATTPPPTT